MLFNYVERPRKKVDGKKSKILRSTFSMTENIKKLSEGMCVEINEHGEDERAR